MPDGVGSTSGSRSGDETPPPARKRPAHRPKGTTYQRMDRRLHEEMRELVETGAVPSLTAAALRIAHRAWPPTSEAASKARRLVATYPWPDPY